MGRSCMKAITSEWLARALDDLLAAEVLLTQPELTNMVAFHAQQTVEKPSKRFSKSLRLLLSELTA